MLINLMPGRQNSGNKDPVFNVSENSPMAQGDFSMTSL